MSVSVWGFGGTVISLSYDMRERDRAREGGTEGERETHRDSEREGRREREREIGRERRKLFFLLPPHERERVAEGRVGGVEREERSDWGGERERGREGWMGGETKT